MTRGGAGKRPVTNTDYSQRVVLKNTHSSTVREIFFQNGEKKERGKKEGRRGIRKRRKKEKKEELDPATSRRMTRGGAGKRKKGYKITNKVFALKVKCVCPILLQVAVDLCLYPVYSKNMNWDWEKLQQQRQRHSGSLGGGPPNFDEFSKKFKDFGGFKMPGLKAGIIAVLALWLLSGIFVVDAPERGVVKRFGEYHREVGPGLHYHFPFPI